MGLLSTLGSTAGTFLGGPVGGTIGGFIGGGLEYSNAQQAASYTNDANIQQAERNQVFQANQADTNRAFQANQAQINRDFQANQTSTAYQRAVSDMKAAGLNPMLAYSQGGAHSGSGSGVSGSSVSGAQAQIQNPGVAAAQQLQSGSQSDLNVASAVQASANARLIDEGVSKIKAEIPNINAQTLNLEEQRKVLFQTVQLVAEQIGLTQQQRSLSKEQIFQSTTQANLNTAQAAQARAIIQKLAQETKLLTFEVKAADDLGNVGREAMQLKPIFDIIRGLLRK